MKGAKYFEDIMARSRKSNNTEIALAQKLLPRLMLKSNKMYYSFSVMAIQLDLSSISST